MNKPDDSLGDILADAENGGELNADIEEILEHFERNNVGNKLQS